VVILTSSIDFLTISLLSADTPVSGKRESLPLTSRDASLSVSLEGLAAGVPSVLAANDADVVAAKTNAGTVASSFARRRICLFLPSAV
jgi:hypothetical protein